MSLGFLKAGFQHLFGLDNWKIACDTYELNIGKAICQDVRSFDGSQFKGKVDLLIGSPPCQSISVANTKTRDCNMELTDELFRLIKGIKPSVWVMENTPSALHLVDAPFKQIFNMADYGLLQARKRCIASNIELKLTKQNHKYLSEQRAIKLQDFRSKVIHHLFQTVTCRYNSFTRISPHIEDENGIRVLSHAEAMQLQTFPFDFRFPQGLGQRELEMLIENAVPPLFSFQLAKSCLEKMEREGLA